MGRDLGLAPGYAVAAVKDPLRFERHVVEKVWGGRALEAGLGLELPPGEAGAPPPPVGEVWELVDREDVSSVVAEGPHAGRTLGELLQEDPKAILGKAPANARGRFPLLLKYLDAHDDLSVQVHPEEEVARRMGGGAQLTLGEQPVPGPRARSS